MPARDHSATVPPRQYIPCVYLYVGNSDCTAVQSASMSGLEVNFIQLHMSYAEHILCCMQIKVVFIQCLH